LAEGGKGWGRGGGREGKGKRGGDKLVAADGVAVAIANEAIASSGPVLFLGG
jgi:hypothetical protein